MLWVKCVYIMQMCVQSFPGKQEWVTTSSSTTKKITKVGFVHLLKTKRTRRRKLGKRQWRTECDCEFNLSEIRCRTTIEKNGTKLCWTAFCVIYTAVYENLNSYVSWLFVCICLHSDPWRNKSFWVNRWNFSLPALLRTSWSLLCMRMGG